MKVSHNCTCFYLFDCRFVEELAVSLDDHQRTVGEVAAGGNKTGYLDLAKKGGGHKGNYKVMNWVNYT